MFWEFPTPEPLLGSKVLEEKIGVFKAIKKRLPHPVSLCIALVGCLAHLSRRTFASRSFYCVTLFLGISTPHIWN